MKQKRRGIHFLLMLTCMITGFCIYCMAASAATSMLYYDGTGNCVMAYEAFEKINEKRTAAGLSSLTWNDRLLFNAMERSGEIAFVFSHTRPNGEAFNTVIDSSVNYSRSGENIAYGYTSTSAVVNAWMNSDRHRANILNTAYTQTAVGCCNIGGTYYWVQLFADGTANSSTRPTAINDGLKMVIIDSSNIYLGLAIPGDTSCGMSIPYVTMDQTVELVPVFYNYDTGRMIEVHANTFNWSADASEVQIVDDSGKTALIKGVKEGPTYVEMKRGNCSYTMEVRFYHTHSSASPATCLVRQICDSCGEVMHEKTSCSMKAPATCTAPAVCKYCNKVITAALGHAYETSAQLHKSATVFSPAVYKYECKRCDAYKTEERGYKRSAYADASVSKIYLHSNEVYSRLQIDMAPGDTIVSVTSSKKKVVKVTGTTSGGKITLKGGTKKGTAKLTIKTAAGAKETVTVQLIKGSISTKKITGVPKTLTIKKGKKETLAPVLKPSNSTQKITYKSSNKKIAAVNAKGKITAKKKGKVTITIKSGSVTVKCKVKVK